MRAKILTLVVLAGAAVALPAASFAGGPRVGVSIAIGGPPVAYYPPPPVVYYPPPPVAYFPPPAVFYAPPVAVFPRPFYAPPPTVVFRAGGFSGSPGHWSHGDRGHWGHGHGGRRWH
jgi:hypothetical protein